MTLSMNANEFDSIEVKKALDEHSDAWRAWNRMVNHEMCATSLGNKHDAHIDPSLRLQRETVLPLKLPEKHSISGENEV